MKETRTPPLRHLRPQFINRNPENPRLIFRSQELDQLLTSIAKHGIQVPITVYEDAPERYILIDGERRWRCAIKLNLRTIPALVQEKPSPLENLLLMYNIHALREQWDYFTIAMKLPRIIQLFWEERGREPNEIELSEATGLTRGQIRRCRFLLDLPDEYKTILSTELELPKKQQRLTEDFFIEMERALKTLQSRGLLERQDTNSARDALIEKYKTKNIKSVLELRLLSKLATSPARLNAPIADVETAIQAALDKSQTDSIATIYAQSVEFKDAEKKALRNVGALADYLEDLSAAGALAELDAEFLNQSRRLHALLGRVLGV